MGEDLNSNAIPPQITQHGVYWIAKVYNVDKIQCPECKTGIDEIVYDISVEGKLIIADCECCHCKCKWRWTVQT